MPRSSVRQPFLTLFRYSVKYYFPLLRSSFIFILGMVLVKDIGQLINPHMESFYVDLGVDVFVSLVLVFLWSATLRASDFYFKGEPASFRRVFGDILKCFPKIFCTLLGFVAIFLIFFMFAHVVGKGSWFFEWALFMLPVFFLFVLFFFAIPNVILHQTSVVGAFRESAERVGFENWLHAFGLYALTVFTWLLVSPTALHEHILANYYLNMPFDLIVLSVCIPILNAMVILSDNDFRIS